MTEAGKRLKSNMEAAESMEATRRAIAQNAATAQQEKEEAIANVYEMAGKIKATNFQKAQSNFFGLLMLKQVKDSKSYRERFGMSWEKFCDHVGVNRRWVDEQLADLKPFKTEFLEAFLQFSGVPVSKIKYLAESITEGNSAFSEKGITYNGEVIPIDADHGDEIRAYIETLEEDHRKKTEELEATLSAAKKVSASKEKVINTLERDLKRLAKRVDLSDLTDEEQDAINLLSQVQMNFMMGISDVKKQIEPHKAPAIALRSYYFLLLYIQKFCTDEREALNETYRDAGDCPWDIMDQEVPDWTKVADNLPSMAGRGIGKKLNAKLDQRKAQAEARKKGKAGKGGQEGGGDAVGLGRGIQLFHLRGVRRARREQAEPGGIPQAPCRGSRHHGHAGTQGNGDARGRRRMVLLGLVLDDRG
ncbi:MAG: hypothetical protein ACYC7J_18505 [Syntrophales bacterium]